MLVVLVLINSLKSYGHPNCVLSLKDFDGCLFASQFIQNSVTLNVLMPRNPDKSYFVFVCHRVFELSTHESNAFKAAWLSENRFITLVSSFIISMCFLYGSHTTMVWQSEAIIYTRIWRCYILLSKVVFVPNFQLESR